MQNLEKKKKTRIPVEDQRLKKIQIRLTESELKNWKEKSVLSGFAISDLIRNFMDDKKWKPKDNRKQHKEKILALARIGNNLNQIAKWSNTYKSTAEAKEVIAALEKLKMECKAYANADL